MKSYVETRIRTKKRCCRRGWRRVLALAVAVGCVWCSTGCQDEQASSHSAAEDSPYLASEEPLELSLFYLNSGYTFDEGNEVFQRAAELTNVSLKSVISQSSSDAEQAFNLMISSKNLADIVQYEDMDAFIKYGNEGAFEDLNPLIEQYAPHIKQFFDENPEIKKMVTSPEGKLYFIPQIPDGEASKGWFIRQDWLDKLGLSAPTTSEEFYQVMKAFKEQDPNGNGQADEIPYFSRDAGAGYENSVSDLLMMFNAYKDFYIKNGTLEYGPIQPEYRDAYKEISKWYQEGLIDQEIYTRGNKARNELLAGNTGGITHDWFASTAEFNDRLPATIENFSFVPFTPPKGPDGVIREAAKRAVISGSGWAISTSNQHKEETMKFFDFWFTEEGRRMENFGIEGKHYTMQDGRPVLTDLVLNNPDMTPFDVLSEAGAQMNFGYQQDFWYEEQWTNDIAMQGVREYEENNYFIEQVPSFSKPDDIAERLQELARQIETYNQETTQKWVLGGLDVDASWDEYIETMQTLGVEEYVSLMQQAYEDYKAK